MSLNDPLANVLSLVMTADKKGRKTVTIKPVSKTIISVLDLLRDNKYLGEYKLVKQDNGDYVELNLLGAINKTGVIKPRHSVKLDEYKKYEQRFLPAFGFGFLIVSTNKGIMTQEEATKQKLGGKLFAYVY